LRAAMEIIPKRLCACQPSPKRTVRSARRRAPSPAHRCSHAANAQTPRDPRWAR